MSAEYRPETPIDFKTMVEKVRPFGIRQHSALTLTDGELYLHAIEIDDNGCVIELSCGWTVSENPIVAAIEKACGVKIWDEGDPEFWGAESFEEIYARPSRPMTEEDWKRAGARHMIKQAIDDGCLKHLIEQIVDDGYLARQPDGSLIETDRLKKPPKDLKSKIAMLGPIEIEKSIPADDLPF